MRQAFQNVLKLLEYKNVFNSHEKFNQLTSRLYSEVTSLIHQKFEELCNNLSAVFEKGKTMTANISMVEVWMECFLDYRDFREELMKMRAKQNNQIQEKGQHYLEDDLLPKNYIQAFDELLAKIANFANSSERVLNEKLNKAEGL